MRRVVVTGLGIISCIGNDANEVADSLKAGRSGITFDEKQAEPRVMAADGHVLDNMRPRMHGAVAEPICLCLPTL